eukprot:scaffold270_cov121-Isochrysis_galbana.AAC.23
MLFVEDFCLCLSLSGSRGGVCPPPSSPDRPPYIYIHGPWRHDPHDASMRACPPMRHAAHAIRTTNLQLHTQAEDTGLAAAAAHSAQRSTGSTTPTPTGTTANA